MNQKKRHFLVVAAASRGARFFVKKALMQGHDVTAICRADDDQGALDRVTGLIQERNLTAGGVPAAETAGKLLARSSNILQSQTYKELLEDDPSIDAICCFVGVAVTLKDFFSRKLQLYTKTFSAMVEGMRQSRWVETFVHGSGNCEGVPGEHVYEMPANFHPKWLWKLLMGTPAMMNYVKSEGILAQARAEGLKFVIFRPAALTMKPAKRQYGYSFDTTGLNKEEHPLRYAKKSISREDVAEEILRVATLPESERVKWHGHGVYLVDMKKVPREFNLPNNAG